MADNTDPFITQTEKLAQKLADPFRKAALDLLSGKPSEKQWFAMLHSEFDDTLERDLRRHAASLRSIGFVFTDEEREAAIKSAIDETIQNTKDVYERWTSAPDDRAITAASWGLGALARNIDKLAVSLIRAASDRLETQILQAQFRNAAAESFGVPGRLSGRKMFLAGTATGGRHSAIHRKIIPVQDAWNLPARPQFGLPETTIFHPREFPSTPRGIKESSGSKSRVLYGYIDPETGNEVFLGPRGGRYSPDGKPLR